jgi:hypothetical protein
MIGLTGGGEMVHRRLYMHRETRKSNDLEQKQTKQNYYEPISPVSLAINFNLYFILRKFINFFLRFIAETKDFMTLTNKFCFLPFKRGSTNS